MERGPTAAVPAGLRVAGNGWGSGSLSDQPRLDARAGPASPRAVVSISNETTEEDFIMSAERLDDTRAPADPRPPAHDAAPVMNPTPARQGRADNRVRYILGIGLVLVIIAFVAVYFGTPTPPTP